MKPKTRSKTSKSRFKLLHQYYSYTGFYSFVKNAVIKALPFIIIIVATIYVVNHYVDINKGLVHLTEVLPVYGVLLFFFGSESFLGLIPPEYLLLGQVKCIILGFILLYWHCCHISVDWYLTL